MTDQADPLPPFGGPLRLEGPAADRAFVVAGTHAALAGIETRGVGTVRLHPFAALRDLRVTGATPESVVVTAVGIERQLDVRGRRVLERATAAPEAALAALEWAVPDASGESAPCFEPVDLEILWSVDLEPAAGPLEIRRGPRGATLHRGEATVAVAIDTPAPASWTLEATAHPGGVRVLARVPPGAFLRLTLTGDEATARPPADSAAAAATHVAARLGAARRRAAASLGVVVPDRILRDALAWAAHRLDELLVQRPGAAACIVEGYSAGAEPRPARAGAVWTALAALAAGDSRLSAGALRYLRTLLPDPDAAAAVLLLAARHLAWTGDAAPLRDAWPDVTRAARICRDAEAASPLASAALAEAAIAAEALRLPLHEPGEIAGAAATPTRRPEHRRALAGAGGWAAFADGRARSAFDAWTGLAAAGIDPGRGLWTGAAGLDDAAATAGVLNGFVYGLLGAEPDAPRHRLRLRPQLPEAWDSADVLRIRMGEASLSLRFRREGALHRFEVEPEAGPVPVRVILEPALPGHLRAAHIDGVAAQLDPRPFGERVIVPVQLVVDHSRTVELEVEPPDDEGFVPGATGPLVRLHRRA
ncbi:MAG TPA: hypothetical protein VFQ38_13275 [Longimicrobiales bacterium]|nr:hypothetical protein [Longimicrobiales bacterium]